MLKRLFNPTGFLAAFLLVCVATLLGACAQLGVPAADTFNKKLIAGYTTVETISVSTATLFTAGKITREQKDNAVIGLRAALTGLDSAAALAKTDVAGADTNLTKIVTGLTALQALLATQQLTGAKPS
jgi:hypothetical protein